MSVTKDGDSWGRNVNDEADYGEIAAGTIRITVLDRLTTPMWVRRLRVWAGRNTGAAPTLYLGLYDDTGGGAAPDNRLARTSGVSVTAAKSGVGGGAEYKLPISVVDAGPTVDETGGDGLSVLVPANTYPGVGVLPVGASLGHSMIASNKIGGANENFYQKTGVSLPPGEASDATSLGEQGHMTVALIGEFNEAPSAPINRALVNPTSSLTPRFDWDFRDNNGRWGKANGTGADAGDRLNRVYIKVRRKSDQVSFWNTNRASTEDERDEDKAEVTYAGTALVRGTVYQWQAMHTDQAGAQSDWSTWLDFSVSANGSVNPTAPSGTQQAITGLTFSGTWIHPNGHAANGIQVRVYEGGTLIRTSSQASISSVANGGTISLSQALVGVTLGWGKTYSVTISGRSATDATWSPFGPSLTFKTNAPPTIPSGLTPNSSALFAGAYPLLTCAVTDADDTVLSGLTVTAEITRPNGSTVTAVMTYNATTGTASVQLTATEINAVGAYSWRASAYDGTVYSGGTTVQANRSWSAPATFTYAVGLTVAVTSPASDGAVLNDGTPAITFSVSGGTQYAFKWELERLDTPDYVESLYVVSTATGFDLPVEARIKNGGVFRVRVRAQDSMGVEGISNWRTFSVALTPPADYTGVSVSPARRPYDPFDTSILVSWNPSELGAAFGGTVVYKKRASEPDSAYRLWRKVTDPSVIAVYDDHAQSGVVFAYRVHQAEVKETGESILSAGVAGVAVVELQGTVLASITDGSRRVVLHFCEKRSVGRVKRQQVYETESGGPPITVRRRTRYRTYALTANLVHEQVMGGPGADVRYGQAEALDLSGDTVSYRDERGRLDFVNVEDFQVDDVRPLRYDLTYLLRSERYEDVIAITPG